MSKKKLKSGKQQATTLKQTSGTIAAQTKTRATLSLLFNIAKPLLFIGVVWALVATNKGYDRLYRYNVIKIFSDIKKYGELSYDEKLGKLLGFEHRYLSHVKDGTPVDAVILAPPRKIWYPEGRKLGFGSWMHAKSYVSYFLYPRKVVYDNKYDAQNPLREQITHVMIVDSWGYDKLQYDVDKQEQFTVMPVQKAAQ